MTDFLKRNITERRESFDVFETDIDLAWEKIDQRLTTPGRASHVVPMYRSWWSTGYRVAAAVALIAVVSFTLLWGTSDKAGEQPTLSMVSPEMAETEQYYTMMISEKMGKIEANRKWVDIEVVQDMLALDQAYTELRTDLADNVDNEEVIHAMIVNYKIKLDILDRILAQIEEAKDEEYGNEPSL